jgi:group II intron reverse transcriptase/maturase
MLTRSFHALKKSAAAGIDGVTAKEYEQNLVANVATLERRLRANQYRAQPLRRVYIGKEDGKQRPLSIPSIEDKIVQRAVAEILGRIYEVDFLNCSYGYRPKRSAHDAVNFVQETTAFGKVNFVYEADIKDYFGSIVRVSLLEIIRKRIADDFILRLISKWLNAGVIDNGQLLLSEDGTYQGSIISPVLANIYLHEVLDQWVDGVVKQRLSGKMHLCRFADDFVIGFQYFDDAKRFEDALQKRFGKYGLTLHPDKTRLIEFGRYAQERRYGRKPGTFQFLGFTFYCSQTRLNKFTVKLKTAPKRLRRSLSGIGKWCKENRHWPLEAQRAKLSEMMKGHYQYYGRISNFASLRKFYRGVLRRWHKWLSRRSNRSYITWDTFHTMLKRHPLPLPRVTESAKGHQLGFRL